MTTERSDRTESSKPRAYGGIRPSWPAAVLSCVAVCAALIFVAWAKMETVQITYRINDLIDAEEELANEQRRLRSELAELRSPQALDLLASGLELAPPEPGHVVVVTGDPEGLAAVLAEDDPAEVPSDDAADEPGEEP